MKSNYCCGAVSDTFGPPQSAPRIATATPSLETPYSCVCALHTGPRRTMMRCWVFFLPLTCAVQRVALATQTLRPHVQSHLSRAPVFQLSMESDKIERLEDSLRELEALGCGEDVLGPLKAELQKLKLANIEMKIEELKAELTEASNSKPSAPLPPPPTSTPTPTPKQLLPPPPPPPKDLDSNDAGLSMDEQGIIMRLGELSFELSSISGTQVGVESLRDERTALLQQLRTLDEALYRQTLRMLEESYGRIPQAGSQAAAAKPPMAQSPQTAKADASDDDNGADDEDVVIIGGKKYRVRASPPTPPAPPPAPPAPIDFGIPGVVGSLLTGRNPFKPMTPEVMAKMEEEKRIREVRLAEARAKAEEERLAREAWLAEEARLAAIEDAKRAEEARREAAEMAVVFAVRRCARGDFASLCELYKEIERADAEIVPPEALEEARQALESYSTKRGLKQRLDEWIARQAPAEASPAARPTASPEPAPPAPPMRSPEPMAPDSAAERAETLLARDAAAVVEEAPQSEDAAATRGGADTEEQKRAARMAEIEACQREIMESLKLSADDRRQALKRLQIKWHPDNFPGDDAISIETREFASVVARIANEAATKAKRVRNKELRKKRRMEAYDALLAAMPSPLAGLMGRPKTSAAALRAAIDSALESGFRDDELPIVDAEKALRKLESRGEA